MNHENKFYVSRFRNRNGVFSFRVDGLAAKEIGANVCCVRTSNQEFSVQDMSVLDRNLPVGTVIRPLSFLAEAEPRNKYQ
jgi:hypothetical protein